VDHRAVEVLSYRQRRGLQAVMAAHRADRYANTNKLDHAHSRPGVLHGALWLRRHDRPERQTLAHRGQLSAGNV